MISNRFIQIKDKRIGPNESCFIIAEVGSNHDGKLERAKQLVDIAVEAKADAVKFQIYSAEKLYSRKSPMMSYLKRNGLIRPGEPLLDLIKRREMPRKWLKPLANYCQKKKIIFLSTPFDLQAVDELQSVNVPAFKIASFEITHLPLLEYIAKQKKPIILSTGMADLSDIELALKTINQVGNSEIILLHCAIGYPPKFCDLNLRAIETMRQAFQLPVGFSDHTLGIVGSVTAVALGASVIEKHFTISRKLSGPDHPFALEPSELSNLISSIRSVEESLGSPRKKRTDSESEFYLSGRQGLIAACDIPKDKKITHEMLTIKRGYGIHPKMLEIVVGRRAKRKIKEDDILTWDLV